MPRGVDPTARGSAGGNGGGSAGREAAERPIALSSGRDAEAVAPSGPPKSISAVAYTKWYASSSLEARRGVVAFRHGPNYIANGAPGVCQQLVT